MASGTPYPPEKQGELLAACIAGEPCRTAAKRLGIKSSTASRWWLDARARNRPVAGGNGEDEPGGTDGTTAGHAVQRFPPLVTEDEADAWALQFLAVAGNSLTNLAALAGDPTWMRGLNGDQYPGVLRTLVEAALAVSGAYERVRTAGGIGALLGSPAETGIDAEGN